MDYQLILGVFSRGDVKMSTQSLSIRPAKEDDMQAFLTLGKAIGDVPGVWGKNAQSDFLTYSEDMRKGGMMLLLAFVEHKKLVGFSTVKFFRRLDPSGFDPKSCTIGVAVHPSYRRRGIGTELIKHSLEEAKRQGFETAYTSTGIENVAMQKLAEKCGFTKYAILEWNNRKFPRYKRRIQYNRLTSSCPSPMLSRFP